MKLDNKNILVLGGAGFIGSHVVSELLKTKIGKISIFDNFSRGKKENILIKKDAIDKLTTLIKPISAFNVEKDKIRVITKLIIFINLLNWKFNNRICIIAKVVEIENLKIDIWLEILKKIDESGREWGILISLKK